MYRYALHMLTDHDKLNIILEGDERLDLVKLFEKVFVCRKGCRKEKLPKISSLTKPEGGAKTKRFLVFLITGLSTMDEMLIAQIKVQSLKAERLEAERPLQCLVSSFHPIHLIKPIIVLLVRSSVCLESVWNISYPIYYRDPGACLS